MSDIDHWITECRAALAQAERLAMQLARLGGSEQLRLGDLAIRIAALRSAIEALDAMRAGMAEPDSLQLHPDWMKIGQRSPWCAPTAED